MIESLLIANRGEIACRIIRTARAMGIRTIAVYSDADAKALHVRQADEAVHIGPSPARESYLVGEKIIAAALETGAQAIHPGYGFLSENADFAQSVLDAGLIWVGPNPDSIRAMGLKDAAKARMIAAGVPVTPGYLGEDQSPDRLAAEADAVGYPVLIKAVAGGGGKGMRRVDAPADFADALVSCQREAASSFGNTAVLIEKYILSPRHIEVQVFGDTHGNVVHLFERDCSLQRRHQKVIEEAPAPGMDAETREAICAAAVKAAKAVDYVGAGTIEFIADASEGLRADRIWFMEMNTRLQVEHPVTEEITGVDLVEWQLRVAGGEPLPKRQDELAIDGWAIEARLYAEDPAKGFLPSIGLLERFSLSEFECRVETGYAQGDTVSPYYDPMIAKLIVHANAREQAAENLALSVSDAVVWPVRTNGVFLLRCLRDENFLSGAIDTGMIGRHQDRLTTPAPVDSKTLVIGTNELLVRAANPERAVRPKFGVETRRQYQMGFRLNIARQRSMSLLLDSQPIEAPLDDNGGNITGTIDWIDDGVLVSNDDGQLFYFQPHATRGNAAGAAGDGAILSPMPGRIIAVDVAVGDTVTKGQKLVTLEAMKMEHSLTAPFEGIVETFDAVVGGQVSEGAVLAKIGKVE